MVDVQTYINKTQRGNPTPQNPYAHATYLISAEQEKITEFHQLISKEAVLSFIRDDNLMRLYQRDIVLLVDFFAMALKDPDMAEVFLNRYYGWLGELALTRTKDGAERKLQGAVGQTSYSPRESMLGYGLTPPPGQEQQGGGSANMIRRLFPGQQRPPQG